MLYRKFFDLWKKDPITGGVLGGGFMLMPIIPAAMLAVDAATGVAKLVGKGVKAAGNAAAKQIERRHELKIERERTIRQTTAAKEMTYQLRARLAAIPIPPTRDEIARQHLAAMSVIDQMPID